MDKGVAMKSLGIIVEYNPFHNGHKYHLEMARKIKDHDIIIAVMSGDYVQRGEPSGFNRWDKTNVALKNGIDIVVELPVYYSTQSSEIFSKGAMDILNLLGVKSVVFGSESGNLENLKKIAKLKEDINFKTTLKKILREGVSYPKGYSMALEKLGYKVELNSNDILGLEYVKNGLKNEIEMFPIKRKGVGYYSSDEVNGISSATKIRELVKEVEIQKKDKKDAMERLKKVIPHESYEIFFKERINMKEEYMAKIEDFYKYIRHTILTNFESLEKIQDIDEGLNYKFYQSAKKHSDFKDFFKEVKSKRYTIGRIQRGLIHILLGITKDITEEVKKNPPYIRVLGFNKNGQKYLKSLKSMNNSIKIITSLSNIKRDLTENNRKLLELNERASIIYRMENPYKEKKIPIMNETNVNRD